MYNNVAEHSQILSNVCKKFEIRNVCVILFSISNILIHAILLFFKQPHPQGFLSFFLPFFRRWCKFFFRIRSEASLMVGSIIRWWSEASLMVCLTDLLRSEASLMVGSIIRWWSEASLMVCLTDLLRITEGLEAWNAGWHAPLIFLGLRTG